VEKLAIYQELQTEVLACDKCDLCGEGWEVNHHDPRVMGQGNLDADIMFVAEAPGKQETLAQQPLTRAGVSGKVYEDILNSMGLTRDDVYTTNVALCRPPNNRDPAPYEVKICRDYLVRQMDLVRPRLVVTFGKFAALAFMNNIKITETHGQVVPADKFDVNIYPVYHPAYYKAYASIARRAEFKADIKKLKKIVKIILAERAA